MEPDISTSLASAARQRTGGRIRGLAARTDAGLERSASAVQVRDAPPLRVRSVDERAHTLILTGELTHRSANSLEKEIERLCEEGVTAITLDLRQLTRIDATGVAVIALRCRLCERQGYGFALIPGSRFVQRGFEQAGVLDALPFQTEEVPARRLHA